MFWRRRRAQSEERRKGWLDVGRRTLFFGCLVTGHSSDVDLDFGADEGSKKEGEGAARLQPNEAGFLICQRF